MQIMKSATLDGFYLLMESHLSDSTKMDDMTEEDWVYYERVCQEIQEYKCSFIVTDEEKNDIKNIVARKPIDFIDTPTSAELKLMCQEYCRQNYPDWNDNKVLYFIRIYECVQPHSSELDI